jgi:hypothetical protein
VRRAVAEKGVEDVRDGDDPAVDRDLLADEPAGIAATVEALDVGDGDRRGLPVGRAVTAFQQAVAAEARPPRRLVS